MLCIRRIGSLDASWKVLDSLDIEIQHLSDLDTNNQDNEA